MDQVIQVVKSISPRGARNAESFLFESREAAMFAADEWWAKGKRVEFICHRCGRWESEHNSHPWACGGAEFEARR